MADVQAVVFGCYNSSAEVDNFSKIIFIGRDQLSLLIFNSFLKIFFLASCNILSVAISLEDKGAV